MRSGEGGEEIDFPGGIEEISCWNSRSQLKRKCNFQGWSKGITQFYIIFKSKAFFCPKFLRIQVEFWGGLIIYYTLQNTLQYRKLHKPHFLQGCLPIWFSYSYSDRCKSFFTRHCFTFLPLLYTLVKRNCFKSAIKLMIKE